MVALLILLLAAPLPAAQAQKPDFSGHWILVSPKELASKPGQEQIVKHDGATLTTSHPSAPARTQVLKLDGSEHRVETGPVVGVTTASWDGPRLVIKTVTTLPDGRVVEAINTWWIDAAGQLVIDGEVSDPPMSMTMVFRKK